MAERKHFVPCFDNFKGAMDGYNPEDVSVSPENVKALLDSFFDYETLQINDATRSWVAFWNHVNSRQEFWWNYFVGQDIKVKSELKGSFHAEAISEWLYADGVEYEKEREAFLKQQDQGPAE